VYNNVNLTNIEKFQYLKGLLLDEPAAIIKHIPISNASYTEAWEKLLARYDKKKQIVSSLIKTFMEQPVINIANSVNLQNLADTSDEVLRALKALDPLANSRDIWLIYILLQKVDAKTREEWSNYTAKEDFPSFEMFLEFINNRCAALELCTADISFESKNKMNRNNKTVVANIAKCIKCKDSQHFLFKCPKFKEMNVKERKQFVYKFKLCPNCLSDKHSTVNQCNSAYSCHFCNYKHHSLLHENNHNQKYSLSTSTLHKEHSPSKRKCENQNPNPQLKVDCITGNEAPENKTNQKVSVNSLRANFALLPTACVFVKGADGENKKIRILCDSGSMATLITASSANSLGLKRKNGRFPITGLGDSKIGLTKGFVELDIISQFDSNFKLSVKALVLDKLTAPLPSEKIKEEHCSHLKNICLADKNFNVPNKIDMILGADHFFSILLPGQINYADSNLIAQNSLFGYLVSGKLVENKLNATSSLHIYELNIDNALRKFWEVEEVPNSANEIYSPEEEFVEKHFQDNHSVNADGRFVVKLPFCKSTTDLGESKPAAISRLLTMERKFKSNSEFQKQYMDFMREYELLGHMTPVDDSALNTSENGHYFLPHHAVVKPSSTTTKLRVVFDASCKSASGVSLNSILGVGPKLQRDIFEILINFRFPEIVFTADVEKMYRQILVADEDQSYQQIVWRYNTNDQIRTYKLKTVTYGLASSSFLATRCIKEIALKYTHDTNIARILLEDIYMDDILSGSDNVTSAISTCKEIVAVLHSHGFHLRKWNSNSPEFLAAFREHCSNDSDLEITSDLNQNSKVLGLFWNSHSDTFTFKASLALTPPLTKRQILQESARIFDPLGLLSPCTVMIKIFYQKLWLTKGDWDTPIPQYLEKDWYKFQDSFNKINHITIPRCVTINTTCDIELHGFADASSLSYAGAIYCRQSLNGHTKVTLLVSKMKVAPIKQISIPRLELCGAHLLAKLFRTVINAFQRYTLHIFAWTDSKVVLSWLSSHPRKWKTFVANRTSQIIEVIPSSLWNYVPSKDNPADIASRGIDPKDLQECDLWWHGPSWLTLDKEHWPKSELCSDDNNTIVKSEQRSDPIFTFHTKTTNELFDGFFEHYSSFSKLIRIFAYCLRFIKHTRKKYTKFKSNCSTVSSTHSFLSYSETREAEENIIRWIQNMHFSEELKCIKEHKILKKSSPLRSLFPFLDETGLLRVGGRLQNSSLPESSKHPIILPSQHKFCERLIREKHIIHLHAGPTLLSHIIRQSYWIIGGKRLINKCINRCIRCIRFKSTATPQQLMGDLPKCRVTPSRPFTQCGIDYAGPISIKFSKGRRAKTTKGHISLFICLSTKAVHIEAVSDLTADAFIAALRRFCARRGTPTHIYSDNATNFHGAHRKIYELHQSWIKLPKSAQVSHYLTQSSIEWHFIPPSSPHFGGLWEAGIRSVKYHLKRVLEEAVLTFEEFSTLPTQIEALLNSRPITYINPNDIDSINALTPTHFLTGDVSTSIPDDPKVGAQSWKDKWEHIQHLRRGFWKRWSHEYVSSLQNRRKWTSAQPNVKMNDLVILKEESPPGTWPLARVIDVHQGNDGLVRVVTLKTAKGLVKRAICKIVPIPSYQD